MSTVSNLELRCRAHNAFEADLCYEARGGAVVREAPAAMAERFT